MERNVYICITESLCCTPGTNTTLYMSCKYARPESSAVSSAGHDALGAEGLRGLLEDKVPERRNYSEVCNRTHPFQGGIVFPLALLLPGAYYRFYGSKVREMLQNGGLTSAQGASLRTESPGPGSASSWALVTRALSRRPPLPAQMPACRARPPPAAPVPQGLSPFLL